MNFDKHSLLLSLIRRLEKARVPADKSHVHKALFLLQEAKVVDVPFEFVYRNGPYSYDVEAELAQMRSYDALTVIPAPGSVTAFRPYHNASMIEETHPLDPAWSRGIDLVCGFVQSVGKPPIELDRQATVVWIMRREEGHLQPQEIISRFEELKSSSSREEIERAITLVAEFFSKADSFRAGSNERLVAA